MSNAIKTYREIDEDLARPENIGKGHLNRSILLSNKIRLLYVVLAKQKQRVIAIMLPKNYDTTIRERLPKWHGIDTKIGNVKAYDNENDECDYVIICQSKDYDSSIFEIIANDITAEMDKMPNPSHVVKCLISTLQKWKRFFDINGSIVMSEQLQQGLYGELVVLKKLINVLGSDAVKCWCGSEKETHDFYVNGNAIEVKTTSAKSNEKVKISSEYQLDRKDVEKELYLYVNMIRKSCADGEKLPQIVKAISVLLNEEANGLFYEKLFNYGYINSCYDKYNIGFFVRAKKCYRVDKLFPCITLDDAILGISELTYSLDLNVCSDYQVEWNEVIKQVVEG